MQNLKDNEYEVVEIEGIKYKQFSNGEIRILNYEESKKLMQRKFANNELITSNSQLLSFTEQREILEKEFEEEKEAKNQRIKDITENFRPKNGEVKKEEIHLPMPTHDKVLKDKKIKLKTYGAMMLESNWGGKLANPDDRYIANNKLEKAIDQVSKELKISPRTIKNHIKKLMKCDVNILEPIATYNGELYYKLNYKGDSNKYYTLIHDKALRKLINNHDENTLRIYLVMLYKCFVSRDKESGEITYKECHLTQEYLCGKIGLAANSRKMVSDSIEPLAKAGFIKVRLEYKINYEVCDNEVTSYPIPNYYYLVSKDYLTKNYIQK